MIKLIMRIDIITLSPAERVGEHMHLRIRILEENVIDVVPVEVVGSDIPFQVKMVFRISHKNSVLMCFRHKSTLLVGSNN